MITRGVWLAAATIAALFVLAIAFAIGLSSGAIAAPGDTVRVSVSSAGVQGNGGSWVDDMSPDGRFVTFTSNSTNFGASNSGYSVYLRDRDADVDSVYDEAGAVSTEIVSLPEYSPMNFSSDSSISSNGRYVAFGSNKPLLPGDAGGDHDVFVRDRVAVTTTWISVSTTGAEGDGDSFSPSISDDGRFVAFCSNAKNFVSPNETNPWDDTFLRDRDTDADGIYDEPTDVATIRISQSPSGGDSDNFSCSSTQISGDGQFVTFASHATNLAPPDSNSAYDVFVWNRLTAVNELASVATGGALGNSDSTSPSISDDGRFVTFRSFASNLVAGDTNGKYDIFLRDRMLGTTERINVSTSSLEANNNSSASAVSNDGRYVTFQSSATNLIGSDTNSVDDIFVRDRQNSTTEGVTVSGSGTAACNGESRTPVISATGLYIGFSSEASNLVSGDTNNGTDAFVHEGGSPSILTCPTPTPSPTQSPTPGPTTPTPSPINGGNGAGSVFKPTTNVKLCNGLPSSAFGDGSVSGNPSCLDAANDGVTITNTLPSGNVYFSEQVTFLPASGLPAAGSPGTLAGGARAAITVGSFNAPCNISVNEDFVLYNVALPNAHIPTNVVYPLPPGTPDRFSKWKVGSEPGGGDPSGIDTGSDPNYAVGTSLAFTNYPSILYDIFDYNSVVPQAIWGALTNFGGQWRPLFLVKLAPVDMTIYSNAFPQLVTARNALGSPLIWIQGDTIKGNPNDKIPTPDNITDVCSPATTTITLTGSTSMTGTKLYLEYLASARDTDQDGYENTIDTCPLNVNVGNPRTGTGDVDADGIDDICDAGATTTDEDGDGFLNRNDKCPLAPNANQREGELFQNDSLTSDRGPKIDYIGDPCDSEGGIRSFSQNGGSVIITMSDNLANGRYMSVTNVVAKCIGSTDADGDGYCVAQDNADAGPCETQAPPSCTTRHNQWSGATHPALQMDVDGDYVSDALETYVGTDPVQSCSGNTTNNNEPMDNWMFDLNDNTTVAGNDTGPFAAPVFGSNVVNGPFGSTPPRPGARFDFNVDGIINAQDTGKFGGVGPYTGGTGPFNKTCSTAGIPAFHQQ